MHKEDVTYSRNQDVVLRLYKALVSQNLEYCVGLHVWSPYMRQEIDKFHRKQWESSQIEV